jgi:hypothetical protein
MHACDEQSVKATILRQRDAPSALVIRGGFDRHGYRHGMSPCEDKF